MRLPGIVGGFGSGPLDGEPRPHPGLVLVLLESKKQMKYKKLEKTHFFGICCILRSINKDRNYAWGCPYFEFSDPDMGIIRIRIHVCLKCALFEKKYFNRFLS
jgi:hypothetical protein